MYVSGSAATSLLPYVGQAKYLKLLKVEKSKNKANGIRSAISQKTTESLQRIDGSKKENSLWPNGIKNSGKQYVQEVTHFFRQNFMPHPSFQLSTANQAPVNVWSRATIENRMDSIVPASLRKVEGKGTTKGTGNASNKVNFGEQYTKVNGKKALKPNIEYKTKEGYHYKTDSEGRISNVEATLQLGKADRNNYAQRTVGREDRLPNDDGGHLIASIFKGSGEIDNLVPMNATLNRKEYKALETSWKKALESGKTVEVKIEPIYKGNSSRPSKFEVEYKINGKKYEVNLSNYNGGS
ncbi:DNA/RNA non-specific endonuclease [Bacillus sp. PK3-056]|nr:DNA/RNA non-specific endonuclease [Niallia circulans]